MRCDRLTVDGVQVQIPSWRGIATVATMRKKTMAQHAQAQPARSSRTAIRRKPIGQ